MPRRQHVEPLIWLIRSRGRSRLLTMRPSLRDAYGSPALRPPRAGFRLAANVGRGRRTSRRRGLPSTSQGFRPRANRLVACAVLGSQRREAASRGSSPTTTHGRSRDRFPPRSRPVVLPKAHARPPPCPAGVVSTPCLTRCFRRDR